jgi:hypothetical protein
MKWRATMIVVVVKLKVMIGGGQIDVTVDGDRWW